MIEAVNLSKNFGDVQALRNLSITVPPGELFCFVGPNGAGKTTTIKLLTGLLHPTTGTGRICGYDIQSSPVAAKQNMAYIPDMPFLYDRLTPREFLLFTGDLYGLSAAETSGRASELEELFGLQEYHTSLIKDMSHGMRQRLIYAAGFLHRPKVLFIDEPLIGLDPYTIRLIKNQLRSKTANGMTVFLTTHILALAEDIADRVAVIDRGRLTAVGTLLELHRNYPDCRSLEDIFLRITGAPVDDGSSRARHDGNSP
ncbi:MAG: ABC transporter ATP-binding protein [Kiritimatiellia bacterium]